MLNVKFVFTYLDFGVILYVAANFESVIEIDIAHFIDVQSLAMEKNGKLCKTVKNNYEVNIAFIDVESLAMKKNGKQCKTM